MNIELKVPAVGESITEVEIGDWLKTEGASVAKDETVAILESEKASVELPAPAAGTLAIILKTKGQTAKVGEVIGYLEAGTTKPAGAEPQAVAAAAEKPSPTPARPTPTARRVLAEHGLRADEVPATGPGGRVSKADVLRHVEQLKKEGAPAPSALPASAVSQPPPPTPGLDAGLRQEEAVRMTPLRRTVARRLVEAQHSAALLTTFNAIDMSAIKALREQYRDPFQKKYGVKLGLMSFFVKAVVDALKLIPGLNAEVRDSDIVYRNYHDLGLAVSTDRGLVVPVLRDADRLSFAQIEQAIGDFAERARAGRLRPEELEGGTFTITNGGVFGSLLSTPLVNPPQSGILGLHAIQERPVAIAGQVVIRPMMYVALTYDHRIVDGREAVLFLRRVKEDAENPARMLLEV